MLPPVFALYRPERDVFQLIQCDTDQSETVTRLSCWIRPDTHKWERASQKERQEFVPWLRGQEWYVVPELNQPRVLKTVNLHGNLVTFWSLRHTLVWSNYLVYARRNSVHKAEWQESPGIPILAFSSKLPFLRSIPAINARWTLVNPEHLAAELEDSYAQLKDVDTSESETQTEAEPEPDSLRIRTPVLSKEEEEDVIGPTRPLVHGKRRSWSDVSDSMEEELGQACEDCTNRIFRCVTLSVTLGVLGLLVFGVPLPSPTL
jgi:hypothetical protein